MKKTVELLCLFKETVDFCVQLRNTRGKRVDEFLGAPEVTAKDR
jgi:hypothetical protein